MPETDNTTGLGVNSTISSSQSGGGAASQGTDNRNNGETTSNINFTGSVIGFLNQMIRESLSNSANMPAAHPSPSNIIDNNCEEQSDANKPISESSEERQSENHGESSPVDYVNLQNNVGSTCQPSPITLPSHSSMGNLNNLSTAGVAFEQSDDGVQLSVPTTQSTRTIKNTDEGTYAMGYDSDGEVGPFFDAVVGEMEDYDSEDSSCNDYDEIPPPEDIGSPAPAELDLPPPEEVELPSSIAPILTEDMIRQMTVAQLKTELEKRNKTKSGTKPILVARLIEAITNPPPNHESNPNVGAPPQQLQQPQQQRAPRDLEAYAPSAKWKVLMHKDTPCIEPQRASYLRGPTIPADEDEYRKFDFEESWDRPPFTAMSKVIKIGIRGNPLKGKKGETLYENEVRTEGRANLEWLNMHGLTENSLPHEWFEAVLPVNKKNSDTAGSVSISQWTSFANLRAILMNAGTPQLYQSWKPFTPDEYKRFIALYIYQGLNPSPRVSMKFKSQVEDPLQGSDLCSKIFGVNGALRHKQWKCFVTLQCSTKVVPPKATHPNFKVDPFLAHMQKVSMRAWDCGPNLSGDEQTIGFKGNHCDKQRVSYKREGDGFLTDALCDRGYTFSFFFRNVPVPRKYNVERKNSPLHSRMLFLFDTLRDCYHTVGMDNLYLSLKFCREAFTGNNKVMIHGVTRRSGRGLPSCVIQLEETNKKKALQARGTTKGAVLEGDPECPNVVAFSVYDTKPVHFLSTCVQYLRWIEKGKKVYDPSEGRSIMMHFLRPKIIDDYNTRMNGVDIADQLRNQYRVDRWMRKRKWWWSIWWWGIQVLLVNSYLLYKTAHLIVWKKDPKTLLSHYEFRYAIVMAWFGVLQKTDGSSSSSSKRRWDDISSITPNSAASFTKRAKHVNNNSLDPVTGSLRDRLGTNFHYIVPSHSKDGVCSLCRWAHSTNQNDRKERVRGKSIGLCDKCGVNLCIKCFKIFHTIGNVEKLRSEALSHEKT
jgi:hypothetical protein